MKVGEIYQDIQYPDTLFIVFIPRRISHDHVYGTQLTYYVKGMQLNSINMDACYRQDNEYLVPLVRADELEQVPTMAHPDDDAPPLDSYDTTPPIADRNTYSEQPEYYANEFDVVVTMRS